MISCAAIANALKIDCNTSQGCTLYSAKDTVLHQKLNSLVAEMDAAKLGLIVRFCNMLYNYDLSGPM